MTTADVVLCFSLMYGQLDRTRKPEPQSTPKLTLPTIQRAVLSNGLGVMLVEHHELPIVQVQLVFQTGAANDPAGKAGVANLAAQMIREGTTRRTSLQIADDLEFLGANLNLNSSTDATFASLLTLKENLGAALDVYSDVLQNPSFPEKEWNRVKKTHITGLMQQKDQPVVVANNLFAALVYGSNHPYGRPTEGTQASVDAIMLDDVKSFYRANYLPNTATLIVVGDVTLKEVVPMVEKYFGDWKSGTVVTPTFSAAPKIDTTCIYLIDKPQAVQSEIRIGHVGVARNNEDYFPLQVMNAILGGQFTSRINLNLRESKGYTYGARSGFAMRKEAGPFLAQAGVKSAVTDSSVIEFMKELRGMCDADVTQKELDFAKNSLIRAIPQGFETPAHISGQLTNLVLYNLPDDYFNTVVQNYEKVNVGDVRRVSQKYLHPASMDIVIVGDIALIKSGVEKLGFGKATVLDTDGKNVN
jgi:predicted Zn-dependent peptidase